MPDTMGIYTLANFIILASFFGWLLYTLRITKFKLNDLLKMVRKLGTNQQKIVRILYVTEPEETKRQFGNPGTEQFKVFTECRDD